jgi:hypothetical protein
MQFSEPRLARWAEGWRLSKRYSVQGELRRPTAIQGVPLTAVVADLAKQTVRFNFMQGAVQFAIGLGAAAICGGALDCFRMAETAEGKRKAFLECSTKGLWSAAVRSAWSRVDKLPLEN